MATKPAAPAHEVPAELAELRASLGSGLSAGGVNGGEEDAGHAGLLPPSLRAKAKKSEIAELDLFGLSQYYAACRGGIADAQARRQLLNPQRPAQHPRPSRQL